MRKRNIFLFLGILVVGTIWGAIYWFFIAPNFGPGAQ